MTEAPRVKFDERNFMENGREQCVIRVEDFRQPFDWKEHCGMSIEEEDCLDALMLDTGQDVILSEAEQQYAPVSDGLRMESDYASEESSDGDEDMNLCTQDQTVEDVRARRPMSLPFNSNRTAGIQLRMLSRFIKQTAKTPIHFFSFFLSFDLVASICFATNIYAESLINQGMCKCYATGIGGRWVKVTTMEMYKFIGILMYMTVVKLPNLGRYWKSDALFSNDIIQNTMNQTRFMAILAFLQISSETITDDKVSRIGPLIRHMKTVSQTLYQPYREVVIADRMFHCKTKLPNNSATDKKQRFGCKLWSLVCSVTGFTYDMLAYLGHENHPHLAENPKGLPYAVVMELLKDFKLQGYQVFLSEFFMSKALTKDLFCKAVYTTGVVKNDSLAIPRSLQDWKEWEEAAMYRDFRWQRDKDNYVIVQWKNRKTVSYMSTLHKGSDVVVETRTPKVAQDYEQGMQGIAKSMLYMKNYPFSIGDKQLLWWKCVFMHCIDIMVVNSYVIYKEYVDRFPTEFTDPNGELEFRESLVRSLLVTKPNVRIFEPCDLCLPEIAHKRDCIFCAAQSKMEGRSSSGNKTIYACKHCEVSLCLCRERNCFDRWHCEEGKSIREWVRIYGKSKISGGLTLPKH